jgi:hypothetical protein
MDIDVPFRELGTVNSAALSAAVKKLDETAWIDCDIRQKSYDVHRQTRSIVLVFAQGWSDIHVGKYSGWNLLAGVAMPVVNEVIENYYPPGGGINRLIEAKRYIMDEGKAYGIINLKFHAVHNQGTEDRYHLIFDYVPPQ